MLHYSTFGYFKGQRNQQHLLFHSEAAPPGSDRWGVECAARSMPLIAPEFYKCTGSDFSKDTRHRLMEAFFTRCLKVTMQNSTSMPWQPPMSCQTCSEVHGTKKKAVQKSSIWQHCGT